jgi:hypothetical protein
MNFLNPAALFGLIAAGIPILLHLLNLRRIKKIEFSSLKFLKELKRSQIRRIKLRQIILLILRTLLILCIVAAFARPMIKGTLPGFHNYARTSAVIFIDNSPSMNFSDEYGNRFNYAKRIAKKIIEQLHSGDEVLIIDMAGNHKINDFEFHSDMKSLTDKVNRIQISSIKADFSKNLSFLPAIFEFSKNINKEVFIISDFQTSNFENFDTTKIEKFKPSFYFLTLGQNIKSDFNNLSLDSVKFITRIFQRDKSLNISGQVKNHSGSEKKNTFISLNFGPEKVAQRKFSITPKKINEIEISSVIKDNKFINGYAELETDALEEDNRRYFGIILPKVPKVAYISNQPNPFILSALGGGTNNYCSSKVFSSGEFNSIDLDQYEVIILESYAGLSLSKLDNYIKNNGRVLFIASNEFKQNPEILSEIKVSKINYAGFSASQSGVISNVMKSHPLFQGVFIDENSKNSPDNIKIHQVCTFDGGLPIIESTVGNVLSEIKLDESPCLFLGVNAESSWSNIQSSTLFPIIIYRSILYLSMLPELSKDIEVGEKSNIIIPNKFAKGSNFTITDPNNLSTPVYAPSLPSGVLVNLENINLLGNYQIINSQGELVGIVSANLPKSESELMSLSNDKVIELFERKYSEDAYLAFINDFTSLREKIERVRSGLELWYFFIVLAIIIAISELVVQRVMKSEVVED